MKLTMHSRRDIVDREAIIYLNRPLKTIVPLSGKLPFSNTEILLSIMKKPLFLIPGREIEAVPIDFCKYV